MSDLAHKSPVMTHIQELQRRLTWVVMTTAFFGIGSYVFHRKILEIIQQPLNQTLYYTSPTGGFSFIFKMCAVVGVILATPIIFYQVIAFLRPMLQRAQSGVILLYVIWSMNLALAGLMFAYFFSLPASLHFLAQFGGENIQSLITADEYFNFALAYLGGFALLFQLPLLVVIINKIKPLKPMKMMKVQRYIILGSFIIAAVLTPTPDPINQAIMAVPVIFLYQISIIIILFANRKRLHDRTVVSVPKPVATSPIVPRAVSAARQPRPTMMPRHQVISDMI